jgi:hypothetical protein
MRYNDELPVYHEPAHINILTCIIILYMLCVLILNEYSIDYGKKTTAKRTNK